MHQAIMSITLIIVSLMTSNWPIIPVISMGAAAKQYAQQMHWP